MSNRSLPYSKIYQHEWRNFRQLIPIIGHDGILVYMYLRTSSHINLAGLGEVPATYISRDLCLDIELVHENIQLLSEKGLIQYDYDTDEVLVIDMVAVQTEPILQPRDKRCGAIYRFVNDELYSDTIRDNFISRHTGMHYYDSYEIAEAHEAPS